MGFDLVYWTTMGGSYFLVSSNLEKYGKLGKNSIFFWTDMAGLGKYHMGGYGRIGVYRVNVPFKNVLLISAHRRYQLFLTVLSMIESMRMRATEPGQLQQQGGIEPGPPD